MSAWVHATAVLAGSAGILIRGPSGSGKSTLAASLIAGGARLVGDDRVQLSACHGRIVAVGAAAIAGRIELRGRGIVAVPSERSAVIRLVADLVRETEMERLPDAGDLATEILGVALPRQPVPRASDRALLLIHAALDGLGAVTGEHLAIGRSLGIMAALSPNTAAS